MKTQSTNHPDRNSLTQTGNRIARKTGWAGFLWLLILWLLAACQKTEPPPTLTPGSSSTPTRLATQTSQPTRSPTPSLMPIRTATPPRQTQPTRTQSGATANPQVTLLALPEEGINTPQPTPTRTQRPPTPTATQPFAFEVTTPQPGRRYQLTTWNAEKANQLIVELRKYPDSLDLTQRGYMSVGYYTSFYYAANAEMEAAWRFPNAPLAEEWRWQAAYHEMTSSPGGVNYAGVLYGELIRAALNRQQTTLQMLETWFENQTENAQVTIHPLIPNQGISNSLILEIEPLSEPLAGIYLWLVQVGQVFSVYPLTSQSDSGIGEFTHSLTLVDLTGDQVREAIINHTEWMSFNMSSGDLTIFDLSQTPPKLLDFAPQPRDEQIAEWEPVFAAGRAAGISLFLPYHYSECGVSEFGPTHRYHSIDGEFELEEITIPTGEILEAESGCTARLIYDLFNTARQGYAPAYTAIREALSHYSPQPGDLSNYSTPLPARNELLFQLGVIQAHNGFVAGARQSMQAILDNPPSFGAEWIELAETFLEAYQDEDDLLAACLATQKCFPFLGIGALAVYIPAGQFNELITLLGQSGAPVEYSGWFNFNRDGQNEAWILEYAGADTTYHGFWILEENADSVRSLYTSYLPVEVASQSVQFLPVAQGVNWFTYEIWAGGEQRAADMLETEIKPYVFFWNSGSTEPIDSHEMVARINLINYRLLTGEISAEAALAALAELEKHPVDMFDGSLAAVSDSVAGLYASGLANELAGNPAKAIAAYLSLWQNYPDALFTFMVRAKLEPAP